MFCICFTPSLDIIGIILVDIIHRFYGEDLVSSELVSKKIILLKFKSCNDEDDDDEDEDDDYVSAKLKVIILGSFPMNGKKRMWFQFTKTVTSKY